MATAKLDVLAELKKINAEQEKLNAAKAKIVDAAKEELLKQGDAIVSELRSLGLEYRFAPSIPEASRISQKKTATEEGRSAPRAKLDKPCPTCGFKTEPLHDARAHRSQTIKAPFTAAELTERGLRKFA
jgi:hypothetical protein